MRLCTGLPEVLTSRTHPQERKIYQSDQRIARLLRTTSSATISCGLRSPYLRKSLIPPLLRPRMKRLLANLLSRPIRCLKRIITIQPNRILRIALQIRNTVQSRRMVTRRPPALGQQRVQNGQRSSHDAEKDIHNDPRMFLLKRPGEIEVVVDLRLNDLPHHAADARDGTDGEEKSEPDLRLRRHFHLIQHNQRHRQQGEVKGTVDDGEAVSEFISVEAFVERWMAALSQGAEFELDGSGALEEFGEEGRDHEADDEGEEDVVRDHPSAGCQARQAAIKKDNRYLDQADRHPENDDATQSKLSRAEANSSASIFFSLITRRKKNP